MATMNNAAQLRAARLTAADWLQLCEDCGLDQEGDYTTPFVVYVTAHWRAWADHLPELRACQ